MQAPSTVKLVSRLSPVEMDRIIITSIGHQPINTPLCLSRLQLEKMLQDAFMAGFNRDVMKTEYKG